MAQVAKGSESERAATPIVKRTGPRGLTGLLQNGDESGLAEVPTANVAPLAPVESAALRRRKTDSRNGGTDRRLSAAVNTRSRCQPDAAVQRIAEEAEARGNARDVLTSAPRRGRERHESEYRGHEPGSDAAV